MITENFDARTLKKMEVALERACIAVPIGKEHEARRHIAMRIMERARCGNAPVEAVTEAGQIAASELCMAHGPCSSVLPCLHPRLHWASSFLGQDQGSAGMSHEAQKRKAPKSLNGITLKPCGMLSTRKANKKSSVEIRASPCFRNADI